MKYKKRKEKKSEFKQAQLLDLRKQWLVLPGRRNIPRTFRTSGLFSARILSISIMLELKSDKS